MIERKKRPEGDSLLRAKRLFLTNLAFLICLILACLFIFSGGNTREDETGTPNTSNLRQYQPEDMSMQEIAYLLGEIGALRQRPETMPTYEEGWVLEVSKKTIRRTKEFSGASESEIDELAQSYFDGYTKRFEDYYDKRAAKEFGHKEGVKVNRAIEGYFPMPPKQIYRGWPITCRKSN